MAVTGIKCARSACESQNACCRHTENSNLYCPRCARGINETNPGLVLFPIAIKQCGSCNCYHPFGFSGDCRDDENRYAAPEDAQERHPGVPILDLSVGSRLV